MKDLINNQELISMRIGDIGKGGEGLFLPAKQI